MQEKILVTRPDMPPLDEYINMIRELWSSRWLTNTGKFHQEFQSELRKYLCADNIELFTNGHMALELSLQALLKDSQSVQSEIITTPFTFISTTNAIIRSGFKPVFCDINPLDFTIDASRIEDLITERTCAIVPVHVYGNICDFEKIESIAKKYNLKVIYDAAHTFGVKFRGKSIADMGDISIFSFHAAKVFHSIEGGAACVRDSEIAQRLCRLRNFGITGEESAEEVGTNAKMNEFCAAMGLCNLKYIDERIAMRKRVYEKYIECLSGIPGVRLNRVHEDTESNYAYFPVIFLEDGMRDKVFNVLKQNNIHARKYFYPITSAFECFRGSEKMFNVNATPIALDISRKVLTLPMYSELSLTETERICGVIRQIICQD